MSTGLFVKRMKDNLRMQLYDNADDDGTPQACVKVLSLREHG